MANTRTRFVRVHVPAEPVVRAMRAALDGLDHRVSRMLRWELDAGALDLLLHSPGNDGGLNAEATQVFNLPLRVLPAGAIAPTKTGVRVRLVSELREAVS